MRDFAIIVSSLHLSAAKIQKKSDICKYLSKKCEKKWDFTPKCRFYGWNGAIFLKIRMIWTACDAGLIGGERRTPHAMRGNTKKIGGSGSRCSNTCLCRSDLFYVWLTLPATPPFRKQKSTAFSIRCSFRSKCQVKALLHERKQQKKGDDTKSKFSAKIKKTLTPTICTPMDAYFFCA